MITVSQDNAIRLGKQYWEQEYQKLVQDRDKYIRKIMEVSAGMESDSVLEEFATCQVDSFLKRYRAWIDDTFPK